MTVIQGKIEEIELPVDQVDVIISEWMGYFLLYESMLDTVIFARDKWLVKGGLMMPDRCAMFMAAIEDEDYKNKKIQFWDHVYNVDMSNIKRWAIMEPIVDTIYQDQTNSNACCFYDIDLRTITIDQLEFSNSYELTFSKQDYVHALVSWFDSYFSFCKGGPITLSTSPYLNKTHWK